jgi:hypothetical protein
VILGCVFLLICLGLVFQRRARKLAEEHVGLYEI